MASPEKYYKPWSVRWIVQRTWMTLRSGSVWKISPKTLWTDYRSSQQVNKMMQGKETGNKINLRSSGRRLITCENLPVEALSPLNRFFDHIFVINLERRADRREAMIRRLTGLHVRAEFFPAEDGGSEENMQEFRAYFNAPVDPDLAHEMEVKLRRKVIVSPGAWGILKTYRKILEEARERQFDKILCLEDDVLFAKNFNMLFEEATAFLPATWKVIFLGASQHTWVENVDLVTPVAASGTGEPVRYYHPLNTDGAFAVGLHSSAFPFLASEAEKMNCPFDSGALRKAGKEFPGACYVLLPNLIIADVRDSDIRTARKQEDFAGIVRWDLSRYDLTA